MDTTASPRLKVSTTSRAGHDDRDGRFATPATLTPSTPSRGRPHDIGRISDDEGYNSDSTATNSTSPVDKEGVGLAIIGLDLDRKASLPIKVTNAMPHQNLGYLLTGDVEKGEPPASARTSFSSNIENQGYQNSPLAGFTRHASINSAAEYQVPARTKYFFLGVYFGLNLGLTLFNKAVLGHVSLSFNEFRR